MPVVLVLLSTDWPDSIPACREGTELLGRLGRLSGKLCSRLIPGLIMGFLLSDLVKRCFRNFPTLETLYFIAEKFQHGFRDFVYALMLIDESVVLV